MSPEQKNGEVVYIHSLVVGREREQETHTSIMKDMTMMNERLMDIDEAPAINTRYTVIKLIPPFLAFPTLLSVSNTGRSVLSQPWPLGVNLPEAR